MKLKKYIVLILLSAFLCVTYQSPVQAQSAEDLARVEKKLSQHKQSEAQLKKKEKKTGKELSSLRSKLVDATSTLRQKEREQKKLETDLADFEKEVETREETLGASRKRLAHLMSSLLQLIRRPPALFLMLESSEDDHVHRTILLRSMLPHLRDQTNKLIEEIDNFDKLRRQAASQRRIVMAARQNLQWQRHNLDQMIKSRQGLLTKTQAERKAIAAQLKDLTSEAKDLRQLMAKVSNPSWGKAISKGQPTEKIHMRGGLRMPVVGEVVRNYGEKDDFGVASEGITLKTNPGSIVIAPQSGKVVFVGPFRGYGQIVILQHPQGYHSFLSGFGRIDTDVGQIVEAGEPLGVLATQGKEPNIYFEWRKDNKPINPVSSGLR